MGDGVGVCSGDEAWNAPSKQELPGVETMKSEGTAAPVPDG